MHREGSGALIRYTDSPDLSLISRLEQSFVSGHALFRTTQLRETLNPGGPLAERKNSPDRE